MSIRKLVHKIHGLVSGKQNKDAPWIPVEKRLPPEPRCGMTDTENLEEYIVTIKGAVLSSTLKYAGDGIWCEDDILYTVIAWMPFPEVYQP